MLPHPGFEIPDAFLQTGVHRPEVNVRRPQLSNGCLQLSNGCLQGGYHGWHHSTERAAKPTRHPTPVNGYPRGFVIHSSHFTHWTTLECPVEMAENYYDQDIQGNKLPRKDFRGVDAS